MNDLLWKALITTTFGYLIFLAVRKLGRLRHHPLQSYPGPKLAALTGWYKAYYEVIKGGELVDLLEKLHARYGPVVRIAPDELHFSDPLAYASIYAPGSKFHKEPTMYAPFGDDQSSVGYIHPRDAKERRDVLSPLFSRRAILRLEYVIQEKVDKLIAGVLSSQTLKKPVNMSRAFRSMTVDIITSYCFAKCPDTLDTPEFSHPLLIAMESTSLNIWIFKYFPIVRSALLGAPEWLTLRLSPQSKGFADIRRQIAAQIDQILEDPGSLERADREIIYHRLLTPLLNHPVPSRKSLEEEANNLLFAGADTVGNTCTIGAFYLLNDKNAHAKLLKELDAAWPEKDSAMGYESLEKLPYLTAVIKESLRMSHGVVTPLPRVVAPTDAMIFGKQVPAGTIVSMGSTFMHWNRDIFKDPLTFSPERWLQPNARELENYLVPFSRGPRSCLGVNLAWCELYLIFANLFRKVDLELCGTTVDDFKFKAYFLPHHGGRFLRARVTAERSA